MGLSRRRSLQRAAPAVAASCDRLPLHTPSRLPTTRVLPPTPSSGFKGQPVCFLFTDAEVKDEAFLEYINQILMTGEVAGVARRYGKLCLRLPSPCRGCCPAHLQGSVHPPC